MIPIPDISNMIIKSSVPDDKSCQNPFIALNGVIEEISPLVGASPLAGLSPIMKLFDEVTKPTPGHGNKPTPFGEQLA